MESLGCVSVICSDKTGTLTQNRMTVEQVLVDGRVLQPGQLRLYDPVQRYFYMGQFWTTTQWYRGRLHGRPNGNSTSGNGSAGRCFT